MSALCRQLGIDPGSCLLIEDSLAATGGFVLYHLLKQALKDNRKVDRCSFLLPFTTIYS